MPCGAGARAREACGATGLSPMSTKQQCTLNKAPHCPTRMSRTEVCRNLTLHLLSRSVFANSVLVVNTETRASVCLSVSVHLPTYLILLFCGYETQPHCTKPGTHTATHDPTTLWFPGASTYPPSFTRSGPISCLITCLRDFSCLTVCREGRLFSHAIANSSNA